LILLLAVVAAPVAERAASVRPESSPASGAVQARDLDQAIDQVLSQPEFSWRMPRVKIEGEDRPGWLLSFVRSALDMLGDWMRALARVGRNVLEWIGENFFNRFRLPPQAGGGGTQWMTSLQWLLYGLLAVVVTVLALAALRMWSRRRPQVRPILATPVAAAPDLADENVLADELPREGWLRLGRQLTERGELRLAVRAFYLAAPADLGHQELIRVARFKSNRITNMNCGGAPPPSGTGLCLLRNRFACSTAFGMPYQVTASELRDFESALRMEAC
jgi:hypothetical protein